MDFSPRRIDNNSPSELPTRIPITPRKKRRLPSITLPHISAASLLAFVRRQPRKRLLILMVCLIAATLFINWQAKRLSVKTPVAQSSSSTQSALEKGTPAYKTYLPNGTSIDQLGGWTRVSPKGSSPVYAYTDTIGQTSIIVSQQVLPDDFKSNTDDHIKELATGYGADDRLSIRGLTVYIGTSAKGPQSVIFRIDRTLILIKSSSALTNDQWTGYITSLH